MNTTSTHASFTGSIPETYDTYLGPLLFESPIGRHGEAGFNSVGQTLRGCWKWLVEPGFRRVIWQVR